MGLQLFKGGLLLPTPIRHIDNAAFPAVTTFVLNGAGDKVALYIGWAENDMTINGVGVDIGAVSGDTSITWRVESLDANGLPSGTLFDGTDGTFTQVVGAGLANNWLNITFTNAPNLAANDEFSVIMEWNSGNSVTVNYATPLRGGFTPYCATKEAAGSWAKAAGDPVLGFEMATGQSSFQLNTWAIEDQGTVAVNTGTTPDEVGFKATLPFRARCLGVWWSGIAAGDYDIVLQTGAAVEDVIETVSVDKDHSGSTANHGIHRHVFANREVLEGNTAYYVTLKPTSGTSITLGYVDMDAAKWQDQLELGQNFFYVSRTDAGSFTETTTRRPLMGLILDQLEDNRSDVSRARLTNGL